MKTFAPDGDINDSGGHILATASADIHSSVKETNGISGAHDEYSKSPKNASPPEAVGLSYWQSYLESPVLFYPSRNLSRVLQFGAGMVGTTAGLLRDLIYEYGGRMDFEYGCRDVSLRFFVSAKERSKDSPNNQNAILDTSKDPAEQVLEEESCNLILVSNVLHGTARLQSTLFNVRKLINLRRRLIFQELTPALRQLKYVMGVLPVWWLAVKDGRPTEQYVPAKRWDKESQDSESSGTDLVISDDDVPHQINANIVSSIVETNSYPRELTRYGDPQTSPISHRVEAMFTQRDIRAELSTLGQMPPPA